MIIAFRPQPELFFFKKIVTAADVINGTPIEFGAPLAGIGLSWSVLQSGFKIISGVTVFNQDVIFSINLTPTSGGFYSDYGTINGYLPPPANGALGFLAAIDRNITYVENTKIYITIAPPLPSIGDIEIEFFVIAKKIVFF